MALAASQSGASTLTMLKRFDKDVEDVLVSSGHVSLYSMSVAAQQWVRKDVEGSLFVIKRRNAPRYQMLVLNKQSTQNYVEDIHVGMDFEVNAPYLMYTHGNSEIIGVWFYEHKDLHTVEQVLTRIKEASSTEPSANLLDFLKQQSDLVSQPDSTATASSRPATAVAASAPADDDSFWDKPNAGKAKERQLVQAPMPAASATPAATGALTDGGSSNLANLLRNAGLKPQQSLQAPQEPAQPAAAAAASGSALPQLLPPSFFSQQRAQPARPQLPAAAAVSPQQPQQPAAPEPAPAPLQPQPSGGAVMGGPLAKLFANAHKPAGARPGAELAAPAAAAPPAAAKGAAAPPSTPPPPAPAPQPQPAPPAAAGGGVPDEERVRRLLARIATNEGLLKMLAAEMRAVGLL